MAAQNLPVVTWDYDFSPYGQKIRTLLKASNVDFAAVEQPMILPRPDLEALGITYRRIPVTAIGRDVFCDSAAIVAALQRVHGGPAPGQADKAYELFGINVFNGCLGVIPPAMMSDAFLKDRATVFPVLSSPRFAAMRPSAVAELQAHMRVIEHHFLGDEPFINGKEMGLADIHVVWSIRWLLFTLEMHKEPGCGADAFPKLYRWSVAQQASTLRTAANTRRIERFPSIDKEKIDAKKASDIILGSAYLQEEVPFDATDPLARAMPKGTPVQMEARDTTEGAHPQEGRLIGVDKDEVVLELANGIRLHFPRTGYNVFKKEGN